MERRRRALGLKKVCTTPEENTARPTRQKSTCVDSSKPEDKAIMRGKAPQKSQPSGSVTPKQKIQISHSNVTPLKPDSPCSPLQSPGSQIMFPGTFASPEIEVSWDWSCSQVPKEMLPPKSVKRVNERKAQLPVLPTINLRSRPRPPLQRQITEEENQQRLEYYKSILSLKPLGSNSQFSTDSTNNNLEDASKSYNTPKRPTTRLSSASKKKDENNSLFDDSANEFMFECSQAIEEKLKNGEIDMGPIVDIKLSQAKRSHSPGINNNNLHKKICHGRINLFPENSNIEDVCSEVGVNNDDQTTKPQNNCTYRSNLVSEISTQSYFQVNEHKLKHPSLNDVVSVSSGEKTLSSENSRNSIIIEANAGNNNLVQKPLANSNSQNLVARFVKPTQSADNLASNRHMVKTHNMCNERYQAKNVTTTNNCGDKFLQPQNQDNTLYKNNQRLVRPQNTNTSVMRTQLDVNEGVNCMTTQANEIQRPMFGNNFQDKSNTADVTALLDDGFDLELSCLDVDSLCQISGNKQPVNKSMTTSAPKLCTQQEIEAKRLAAIQKLKMKKKR